MIYFDAASTAYPKHEKALRALCRSYGNPYRSSSALASEAFLLLEACRRKLADRLGLRRPSSVIFTSGATQSLNFICDSLIPDGARILSSDLEHNSVLRPLFRQVQTRQADVHFLGFDEQYQLRLDEIETCLREKKTYALLIQAASNVCGSIQNLPEIAALARRYGAKLFVDAAQAVGYLPLHLEKIGIDALAFSTHKALAGPMGLGVLALRGDVPLRESIAGGTGSDSFSERQPRELPTFFEAGTPNVPAVAALSEILDEETEERMQTRCRRLDPLRRFFLSELETVPDVTLFHPSPEQPALPIFSFNLGETDPAELETFLAEEEDIASRSGTHCAPRFHRRVGSRDGRALRFSFSEHNTCDEIRVAVAALKKARRLLR